jgi:hypothetical protein
MSTDPQSPQKSIQERMAELAAEFVQNGKSAGVSLDYLPRTLPIAEKFVKGAPAETERMAAYLGEVIRRETKGFWFEQEYVPMVYAGVEPYVDPAAVVQSLLETSKAAFADTTVESAKAYCETISRLHRQWLDRTVMGRYQTMTVLRTEMSADAKTAGTVLALAQQAILTAQMDWSEPIDCSADSLDAVERILGGMHNRKKQPDAEVTDEQVDSLSRMMGVVIGEVVRRNFGGQWRATEAGSFEIPYPGTTIDPIARARKRIVDGPAENVKMYFSSMAKVIAS